MKNIFWIDKIFISKKKSRKFSEHLCRSKISPGIQKSYLENRTMSLTVRKLQHRKTILYIRNFIQNITVYKGSQVYIFIYGWAYIRFSPKAKNFGDGWAYIRFFNRNLVGNQEKCKHFRWRQKIISMSGHIY